MNKFAKLITAIAVTGTIGGSAIFGNSVLASHVLTAGIPVEMAAVPAASGEQIPLATNDSGEKLISTMQPLENAGEPQPVFKILERTDDGKSITVISNAELTTYDLPSYAAYTESEPGANDISQALAMEKAVNSLVTEYALKQETLDRFTATTKFYTQYEDIEQPVWWVNFYPTIAEEFMEIGCYTVLIDSITGDPIRILTAADGKG